MVYTVSIGKITYGNHQQTAVALFVKAVSITTRISRKPQTKHLGI